MSSSVLESIKSAERKLVGYSELFGSVAYILLIPFLPHFKLYADMMWELTEENVDVACSQIHA